MSKKELTRLEVMQRLEEKRLKQKEAAQMMGIGVRQVKRLRRKYKQSGAAGLVSKRRGKPSNNQLKAESKQKAIELLHSRYSDFGPTLAHEKLIEAHKLSISVETVRRLMIAEGLWRPRRARRPAIHPMRKRRACLGELVQIDGSPHDWFEGRAPACSLLVFIDDASGRLMAMAFVLRETMFAYCEVVRAYLTQHGKPVAFYSDKHSIFRVNHPHAVSGTGLTQFGRAMQALDIQIICANTPQAKGRVERAIQTLQDRLVKEMRLRDIADMVAGNAYLPEFMQDFNTRFAVAPRSSHDAHCPLSPSEDLDRILTWQETRTLSKNLTLQYHKVIYQVQTSRPGYAMRNARVTVSEDAHGQISILYKGHPLSFSVYHKHERQAEVASSKAVNHKIKKPHRPADDHPWRRDYGHHLNGRPIEHKSQP